MESADEMEVDNDKKATQLAEAQQKLGAMSFLCNRVQRVALPIIEIDEEGANEWVAACVRHVVEGGLARSIGNAGRVNGVGVGGKKTGILLQDRTINTRK